MQLTLEYEAECISRILALITHSERVSYFFDLLSYLILNRFAYPKPFLQWALQPPGYHVDWHIGVRVKSSGKLVAFITGIPATITIDNQSKVMAEINFLCIHKKLRSKRLAPVLIKEITRKVNLRGVWQATYTAGTVLPKPIASCRYYHRSLNPKKLIDIGFSKLGARMTMARTIKLFSLPTAPVTPGLRKMVKRDVAQVKKLLDHYLTQFRLHPNMSEDEVEHWLLSRPEVVTSYVVVEKKGVSNNNNYGDHSNDGRGNAGNGRKKKKKKSNGRKKENNDENDENERDQETEEDDIYDEEDDDEAIKEEEVVTDLVSFYCLPSTIIGNDKYKTLKAAYLYYYVCKTVSLKTLLGDALIMAKNNDFDVFNALDIMINKVVPNSQSAQQGSSSESHALKELKFGIGDGNLQYYLYNWRVDHLLVPNKVGLVLL